MRTLPSNRGAHDGRGNIIGRTLSVKEYEYMTQHVNPLPILLLVLCLLAPRGALLYHWIGSRVLGHVEL